ncbi:GNAT family N-acetyltransferase [Calothrix sp. PCC 6303]|uniref:GNAT family N-acetyltransferase n=1 Tax=Calothrix sp. PCC 6303 TaxID=1170562 RepID=UPI0002A05281|nr:GNAT family N-acetyltransferase [Calothrix sp. PCC 6303]AFZ04540.1 GCN5-related N-acetyltransferase [Calothrix sp. PCC 6303]
MTTDAQIKIESIDNYSQHLATVIKLWRANSKTLGNLPKGAFEERAAHRQILVALDSEGSCVGYLLYRRSRDWFAIAHLCIDPDCRGKGVAKQLVDRLKQITTSSRGIRLSCRRDYNLQGMWSSFGFIACKDTEGRSKKKKTILTRWVFEHNPLPLFSTMIQQQLESRLCAVIAPDIFWDLYTLKNDDSIDSEEGNILLADWVQTELNLCINDEILNQINRIDNSQERDSQRCFAESFTCLPCNNQRLEDNFNLLQEIIIRYNLKIHESNLRYIARSITSESNVFLTRDKQLLDLADVIYENFRFSVIHPEELILRLDELRDKPDYQPVRLSGTSLEQIQVQSGQEEFLANYFHNSKLKESQVEFQQKLRRYLAEHNKFECVVVRESDTSTFALIVYGKQKKHELEIPILRVGNHNLSSTLARHIIFKSILKSASEQRHFTRITDPYLEDAVTEAIQEDAFVKVLNGWLKANLSVVKTSSELSEYITSLVSNFGDEYDFIRKLANNLNNENIVIDAQSSVDIERFLFPAKITNYEIPTFIIPIQPRWASCLFDEHLANQMLPLDGFGAKPELAFNREAVYYRAIRNSRGLNAPCRILWYISETQREGKGKGFYNVRHIRACSYVDEVIIGKPKELYRRFQRLGVYQLSDVESISKDRKTGNIMAIRFSNTELFNNPVSYQELQQVLNKDNLLLVSPNKINKESFIRLYNLRNR